MLLCGLCPPSLFPPKREADCISWLAVVGRSRFQVWIWSLLLYLGTPCVKGTCKWWVSSPPDAALLFPRGHHKGLEDDWCAPLCRSQEAEWQTDRKEIRFPGLCSSFSQSSRVPSVCLSLLSISEWCCHPPQLPFVNWPVPFMQNLTSRI